MTASPSPAIGFVGVGNMGRPMIACIAASGRPVLAFDSRSEALADLAGVEGVAAAASLADLGACDTVITMLPDDGVVRAVILGDAQGGGLAETCAGLGIGVIDAPVSGGVPRARSGTLAIMAGGNAALVARQRPLLETMGQVTHCGQVGAGHAMKALNNYVSAAGLIAVCEALTVAERFGLDPRVANRVLDQSTGSNNTTRNKVEQFMLNDDFGSGFALGLMAKDVGIARALAEHLGLATEELAFCAAYLRQAERRLGPAADHTEIFKLPG